MGVISAICFTWEPQFQAGIHPQTHTYTSILPTGDCQCTAFIRGLEFLDVLEAIVEDFSCNATASVLLFFFKEFASC